MEQKNITEHFNRIYRDIRKYVELKFELFKLEIVEITVAIYSKIIILATALLIFSIVLLFAAIALSLYLGELWGHNYLGFLAVAGGLLILFFIFLIFKNQIITNPLLKSFIEIFFNINHYEHKKIKKNK